MMSYFVQLFFSASLLLLAAVAISLIFRRQSASLRYKLWSFVMVGLLLLPMLVLVMSQSSLGVIPLTEEELEMPFITTVKSQSLAPEPHYLTEVPRFFSPPESEDYVDHSANLRQAELEWERAWMADAPSSLTMDRIAKNIIAVKYASENEPAEDQHGGIAASILGWLLCLWIVGTVVLLFRFLFSFLSARRLLRRMMPVESESVQALADHIARRMWVYRPITLLQNEVATVPFTLGIRRPKIVLPAAAMEHWSEAQVRTILTHEIAHIQRGDVWGQWLTQLAFCLYWFHPLLWFAAWRIRVTRELACDDLVLLGGEEPADFADMLLELANSFSSKHRFALGCGVAIFERKNIVRQRITAILNRETHRIPVGKLGTLALLFIATVGVTFASILSPFEDRHSEQNMLRDFRQQLKSLEPSLQEKSATFRLLQRIYDEANPEKEALPPVGEMNDDQITMLFRFIAMKEPLAKAVFAHKSLDWTGLPIPGDPSVARITGNSPIPMPIPISTEPKPGLCSLSTTPPLPLFVRLLDKLNTRRFEGLYQNSSRINVMQTPNVTFISGESGYVSDVTERPFVTSLIPVVGDFAVALQPVIQIFREGVTVKVKATLLEDHSCRMDECVVDFSTVDDVVKVVTLRDGEGGVQVPKVRSYCISIPEIVIPDGMSLLVAVPGITQASEFDPIFLMITPQWIESDPETKEFLAFKRRQREVGEGE